MVWVNSPLGTAPTPPSVLTVLSARQGGAVRHRSSPAEYPSPHPGHRDWIWDWTGGSGTMRNQAPFNVWFKCLIQTFMEAGEVSLFSWSWTFKEVSPAWWQPSYNKKKVLIYEESTQRETELRDGRSWVPTATSGVPGSTHVWSRGPLHINYVGEPVSSMSAYGRLFSFESRILIGGFA